MSEKADAYRFCVVDLHQRGRTGLTIIDSPATHVTSITLASDLSLEEQALAMRDAQREHRIRSFWVEGDSMACDYLRRIHGLPVRRVAP